MARKLATIQKVATVEPIKKADFIVKVTLENLGWQLVAKKGDFKKGDLCVFFEIDSVLPKAPWSEFMAPVKYRVKTAKFRGVLSQGLAMPVSILLPMEEGFNPLDAALLKDINHPEYIGMDVTGLLGVTKYEVFSNASMGGSVQTACAFPRAVLPKTDETRLQSCPDVLDELKKVPWYATVKCDGTSATFVRLQAPYGPYKEGDLMVCTRNRAIRKIEPDPTSTKQKKKNAYFKVAHQYDLFKKIPRGFAVQGELVGPGIQKNPLGLADVDLYVFNVWNSMEMRYLDYKDALNFCIINDFNFVPLVGICSSEVLLIPENMAFGVYPTEKPVEYTLEWFLKLAEGKYHKTKKNREGIVVRPLQESVSETLGTRFSFKVINNTFLLKDEA